MGAGLTALVEITLDRQGAEHLDAFEQRAVAEAAVQQCWRVSPGPDFVLVVHGADMAAYHALVQRLFTQDANVRNVKAFFSVKRAKFDPRLRPRRAQAVFRDRQPLEVFALGEEQRRRVVGRGFQPLQDGAVDAGVDGRRRRRSCGTARRRCRPSS